MNEDLAVIAFHALTPGLTLGLFLRHSPLAWWLLPFAICSIALFFVIRQEGVIHG